MRLVGVLCGDVC